jgi:Uma2 family endonuclease
MKIFGRCLVSPVFVWLNRYMESYSTVHASFALNWYIRRSSGTCDVTVLEIKMYWSEKLVMKLDLGWRPDVTWSNWNHDSYLAFKKRQWDKQAQKRSESGR